MTGLTANLKKREATGKAGKRALGSDQVAGVVYGKDVDAVPVVANFNEITKLYNQAGGNHVISVTIEGEKQHDVLFKALDRDPITERIRHFDLFAVKKGEKIKTEVPVEFVGDAPAAKVGLAVTHLVEQVEVESEATKIPDHFEVNVEKLAEIGDHITVGELRAPEGVEILTDPEQTLVKVEAVVEQVVEEPEAEGEAAEGEEGEAGEGEASEGKSESEDSGEKTEE